MNGKLQALLRVFRQGEAVADPAVWRNRTDAANAVMALLATLCAVAHLFGFDIPVGDEDLAAIALGIVALVGAGNAVVHIATDPARGLARKEDAA